MAISHKQGVAPDFQLAANLKEDDETNLGDPKKLLQQLSDKYNAQKSMYMEARNYYFNLNLWVFYMPILVVQGEKKTSCIYSFSNHPESYIIPLIILTCHRERFHVGD